MSTAPSNNFGSTTKKLGIAMTIIPFLFVAIRLWSRVIVLGSKPSTSPRIWWDDWLAVATLPFITALNAVGIYWTTIGLGTHISQVSSENVARGLIILYANYPLYDFSIALPRFSALFFYARVFNARCDKLLWNVLWITGAFNVGWLIFAILSAIFECTPIDKAWKPTIEGHCINVYAWWMAHAISSVIIDLVILLIPMPILWKLTLRPLRKFLLLGVFVCGYFVIAISIGRLVSDIITGPTLTEDWTYNIIPVTYCLALEAPLSVVSICLPSIFSLVKRGIKYGPHSLFTSKSEVSLDFEKQRSGLAAYQGQELDNVHRSRIFDERPCKPQKGFQSRPATIGSPSLTNSQSTRETYSMDIIRAQPDLTFIV